MAFNISGIVINEVLVNPRFSSSVGFDTNGDGTVGGRDEFIELYNTSGSVVDISGWQIHDNVRLRYTFGAGTLLPARGHLVLSTHDVGGRAYIDNGGDGIALYNPLTDEYIAATVGANPKTPNVPDEAIEVGTTIFGNDVGGQSLQRSPDGSDNIILATPTPECFLTGTRILTEQGEVPVETLKIGDRVQTNNGMAYPIKWIGYQTIDPCLVTNALRSYPILVKASALGHNVPSRDLYVSPDHALLFEGLLINAGALVNGCSILKTEPTTPFTYYHLELEHHALLTAEGTLAESYLPQKEDRLCYDNGAEYDELYPGERKILLWPLDYPRISSYTTVPRYIRKRLMAIARNLSGGSDLKIA